MVKELLVGDKAPNFELLADGGDLIRMESLLGKSVILYFYPKDDTSGCTKEAIEFTRLSGKFAKLGAVVIGVSKDDVKTHDKFVKKHKLGVRLLSDIEGDLCESYGVWVEKSMYGRKYMGIERATFLINADGLIEQIWRKVKVTGHGEAVLYSIK